MHGKSDRYYRCLIEGKPYEPVPRRKSSKPFDMQGPGSQHAKPAPHKVPQTRPPRRRSGPPAKKPPALDTDTEVDDEATATCSDSGGADGVPDEELDPSTDSAGSETTPPVARKKQRGGIEISTWLSDLVQKASGPTGIHPSDDSVEGRSRSSGPGAKRHLDPSVTNAAGAAAHPEARAPPAAKKMRQAPRHRNGWNYVQVDCYGWFAYNDEQTQLNAHCANPNHGSACHLNKTIIASDLPDRQFQGRSAALSAAWLFKAWDSDGKDAHDKQKARIASTRGFEERKGARQQLENDDATFGEVLRVELQAHEVGGHWEPPWLPHRCADCRQLRCLC